MHSVPGLWQSQIEFLLCISSASPSLMCCSALWRGSYIALMHQTRCNGILFDFYISETMYVVCSYSSLYYADYDDFECRSVKRPPRYNSQLDLVPR